MLNRRRFLLSSLVAIGGVTAADAFGIEPHRLQIVHHDVPVPGLSPSLDGARIAQLTDLHLHSGLDRIARQTIDVLRQESADLVVMTGDMCENARALPEFTEFARGCGGHRALFGVLGNWEAWARADRRALSAAFAAGGGQLLVNQTRFVQINGKTVGVVGLDDPRTGRPDPVAAMLNVPKPDLSIWLVHAPGFVDQVTHVVTPTPALILSGHTHGGQIRLPALPAICPAGSGRFVEGWYRDTVAPLYVSRGLGTSVIRARLFCPPEITFFTLRRT